MYCILWSLDIRFWSLFEQPFSDLFKWSFEKYVEKESHDVATNNTNEHSRDMYEKWTHFNWASCRKPIELGKYGLDHVNWKMEFGENSNDAGCKLLHLISWFVAIFIRFYSLVVRIIVFLFLSWALCIEYCERANGPDNRTQATIESGIQSTHLETKRHPWDGYIQQYENDDNGCLTSHQKVSGSSVPFFLAVCYETIKESNEVRRCLGCQW